MTEAAVWSRLARRPAHVAEWEDLLIRFEVAPQALRHTLDGADLRGFSGTTAAAVAQALATLVDAEAILAGRLWAMRTGEAPPVAAWPADAAAAAATPADLLDGFARLRMRNFVMVQRRGLDVWDWAWSGPDVATVSAFQLLAAATLLDVRQLGQIRRTLRDRALC